MSIDWFRFISSANWAARNWPQSASYLPDQHGAQQPARRIGGDQFGNCPFLAKAIPSAQPGGRILVCSVAVFGIAMALLLRALINPLFRCRPRQN
jgi:hypothetical protein